MGSPDRKAPCGFVLGSFVLGLMLFPASVLHAAILDLDLLRDPTAPLNYVEPESVMAENKPKVEVDRVLNNFKLSSVLIRSDSRIAIINNERVKVGEQIGIATVTAIDNNSVTLKIGGETRQLKFYQNTVKTQVSGGEK